MVEHFSFSAAWLAAPLRRKAANAGTPNVPPVRYDMERMSKAVEEPGGVVVPEGLSASEVLAFFDKISAVKA